MRTGTQAKAHGVTKCTILKTKPQKSYPSKQTSMLTSSDLWHKCRNPRLFVHIIHDILTFTHNFPEKVRTPWKSINTCICQLGINNVHTMPTACKQMVGFTHKHLFSHNKPKERNYTGLQEVDRFCFIASTLLNQPAPK